MILFAEVRIPGIFPLIFHILITQNKIYCRKPMRKFITLLTLLSCLGSAHAQETKTQNLPTKLATIVVKGSTGDSSTIPSAANARAQIEQVPGGVNFIEADDSYLLGRTSNLRDALDYQPGIYIQPRFGAQESRISIRGSGLGRNFHGRGILMLQDGAPLNLADGGFDMQSVEPLAVDYIHVYRGGNGIFVGSANLGGAIDFVSRTGYSADKVQLRLEAGSFGYIHAQASSGMVVGPYDYYASVTEYKQDGFRAQSKQNNQNLFSNFGVKITDNVENRTFLNLIKTDSQLPGQITKGQMTTNPEQANAGNIALNQQRDYSLMRLANRTTVSWDGQELNGTLFWTYKDLYHPIVQVIDQVTNDPGIDLNYRNKSDLLDNPNNFIVGARTVYGYGNDARYFNNLGNTGAQFLSRSTGALNVDLYCVNEYTFLPSWTLVTGAELNYASRSSERIFPNAVSNENEYLGFNPYAGARYAVNDKILIYGNVSRSFEAPSFGELQPFYQPPFAPVAGSVLNDLSPQTATTIEIGTRGECGPATWDVTFYHSLVDNELLTYNLGGGASATRNADQTIHQGIELGLNIDLFQGTDPKGRIFEDRLWLRQVYNWQSFTFDNDPQFGNNQIASAPENYYRAELLYEHPCGFYAGPNVEWVPSVTYIDNANTYWANPYALLGFKIGYVSPKGFNVFFEAKNLTDETYASAVSMIANAGGRDSAQFLPGDGRGFYGGVVWKW